MEPEIDSVSEIQSTTGQKNSIVLATQVNAFTTSFSWENMLFFKHPGGHHSISDCLHNILFSCSTRPVLLQVIRAWVKPLIVKTITNLISSIYSGLKWRGRKHNIILYFFHKVAVNVARLDQRGNDFWIETCKYWKIGVSDGGATC